MSEVKIWLMLRNLFSDSERLEYDTNIWIFEYLTTHCIHTNGYPNETKMFLMMNSAYFVYHLCFTYKFNILIRLSTILFRSANMRSDIVVTFWTWYLTKRLFQRTFNKKQNQRLNSNTYTSANYITPSYCYLISIFN